MGARPSSFKKVEAKPDTSRQWSVQQEKIFEWFQYAGLSWKHDEGSQGNPPHLIVRARAGTGKTTTILEGVERAPESNILLCAFNKKIAEELNGRLKNPKAVAKTLHAVGYAAIRRQWRGMPVGQGSERADWLTAKVAGSNTPHQIRKLVTLLHTKGREMTPLSPDTKTLTDLALFFDYVPDESWVQYPLGWVVEKALEAMQYAAKHEPTYDVGIDFADMLYLPLVWQLLTPEYDLVVGDEAQDMNVAQLTMLQRLCSGRMCFVGDNRQAIYAFRGADTGSLDRLKQELGAVELGLTVTYRCGQSIVKEAQTLVPDIEAAPANPEGEIRRGVREAVLLSDAQPGDFVLSRLNAPLVSLTLRFLRDKKRARMNGRDIGAGIRAILTRLKCFESTPIEDMLTRLVEWERKQVTKYASYGHLALVERTRDQAGMLVALAEGVETTGELLRQIDWLFVDVKEGDQILCSSVHKAKGLEASTVWLLQDTFYRRGRTPEEDNIFYVAVTRAKQVLNFVQEVA